MRLLRYRAPYPPGATKGGWASAWMVHKVLQDAMQAEQNPIEVSAEAMLKLALTAEDRKTGSPLFQVWATNETWWVRPHPEAAQAGDAQSGEAAMKESYQDDDESSEPTADRMKKARKEDQMSSTENTPEPPISGAGGVLDAAQSAQ